MLRFGAAVMIAALVWLGADRYVGQLFSTFGALPIVANYGYRAFAWACMSAGVLIATPAPRHWPTILICGLALSVALLEARMITLLTVANGAAVLLGWFEALAVFAPPAWLIWLWYNGSSGRRV